MKTKERLITVSDAFGVIKRFFVLLLAAALVCGALGLAYAYLSKNEYYSANAVVYFHTATADMIEGPDANDISRARALAASCAEVFPNDAVVDNIRRYFTDRRADRPNENWEDLAGYSDAAIKSMLSAATEQSSQKLTITVNAPTAALACHLANAAAGELQVSITDTVGACRIELTSAAKSARLYSDFSVKPAITLAVVGLVCAYLVLFAYAYFDPRMRTVRDLTLQLEDGAVIGAVGARRVAPAVLDGSESTDVRESYNTVRMALLSRLSDLDAEHPVVGLAGIGEGDTASVLAANLAISLSRISRRVLVLDADYRSASLASALGFGEEGKEVVPFAENAYLLPRGEAPENAADYLGSAAFRDLLSRVKGEYDLVLVKLPSVSGTSDAMTAAPVLDAMIACVSLAGDSAKALALSASRLDTVEANVLGYIAVQA